MNISSRQRPRERWTGEWGAAELPAGGGGQ
jgi:hypothetical protein